MKAADTMRTPSPFRATLLSQALAAALAAAALPVAAGIVTSGAVNPNPSGGTVIGVLAIGNGADGSVTVNGGSTLTSDQLWLGTRKGVEGILTITGAGSRMAVTFNGGGNLDLGQLGFGRIDMHNGASLVYGNGGPACQLNCRVFVSNGAGSDGTLTLSGGSSFGTVGGVVVGNASMFTVAADGRAFGAPGGASDGYAGVTGGARASSSFLSIGQPGGGLARTTETSTGNVVVDGLGSVWNLVRNAAQAGAQALLRLGSGIRADGTLTVRNGGVVALDGAAASGEFGGINIAALAAASNATGARGAVEVTGAGSRVTVDGGVGFMNIGRGNGADGRLTISDGGSFGATNPLAERGLISANVGRGGATGTMNITGAGSQLLLSGRQSFTNSDLNSNPGAGAFMQIGRREAGAAGTGTVNVTAGGRITIDNSAFTDLPSTGQTGMNVGIGAGSSGNLTVSGAASWLDIATGSGAAIYTSVGRDGATGTMTVASGGKVTLVSAGISTPSGTNLYLPGDVTLLEIGRNAGVTPVTSIGVVTVTGAGSEITLGGSRDHLIQLGRGDGGNGTLNITAGGRVATFALLVGTGAGAVGTLNMDNGRLDTRGVASGGPAPGNGGGLGVGRGGGTGVAHIGNGSVVSLSSTAGAGLSIGGTPNAIGGIGTVMVSGGSSISVDGPNAVVGVGRTASVTVAGIGSLNIVGAGSSVSATGTGAKVLLGAAANTIGTVNVGVGASLSASSLIGLSYDGNVNTGGISTLVVNGTASAPSIVIGQGGTLAGSGAFNGNVVNRGHIKPGESPGRLTLNGGLDNSAGKIVLEVQSLGGGLYAYDEIVFGDPSQVTMGAGEIEFAFLGDTDPVAFMASGLFELDSFFKEVDGLGNVVDLPVASLGLFTSTRFDASAERYVFTSFVFDPYRGARLSVVPMSLPGTLPLVLAGLALLVWPSRRRPALV